jgi:hypothetical protein
MPKRVPTARYIVLERQESARTSDADVWESLDPEVHWVEVRLTPASYKTRQANGLEGTQDVREGRVTNSKLPEDFVRFEPTVHALRSGDGDDFRIDSAPVYTHGAYLIVSRLRNSLILVGS